MIWPVKSNIPVASFGGAGAESSAPASGGLDPATTAWVNAVITNGGTVSGTQQTNVNNLIVSLKANSLFSKLDRLWLFASENGFQALTDIIADSLATKIGTPTFTANVGYTGQDLSSPFQYIDTGYNPTTGGNVLVQNSAHISGWGVNNIGTPVSGGAFLGYGSGSAAQSNIYAPFTDGHIYCRINDTTPSGSQGSTSSHAGHFMANRSDSTHSQLYYNGSLFSSPNDTSTAPQNLDLFALAFNSGGSALSGTPNQIAMISVGGSFGSTDVSNFYSALRTYMTAVGVP
jgi:hypothetical protein